MTSSYGCGGSKWTVESASVFLQSVLSSEKVIVRLYPHNTFMLNSVPYVAGAPNVAAQMACSVSSRGR
jgi:hypothetical protein